MVIQRNGILDESPVHHDDNAARAHDGMREREGGNIARSGAPKRLDAPRVAMGMHTRSRLTGDYHFGADALSRADSDPANPLLGPPAGKRLTDVKAVPGMRSRSSDTSHEFAKAIGRAVLASATHSPDDAMALPHFGLGSLPESTSDK